MALNTRSRISVCTVLAIATVFGNTATAQVNYEAWELLKSEFQRRLHNFGRCDEWNLCLTARTVVRANQEPE